MGCYPNVGGIKGILCTTIDLLNYVVPVLIALGVVYFVWGVVQYVIGDGEEAKKAGKDRIIFGIIGLFVIVAMWGLVNLLIGTFRVGGARDPNSYAPSPDQIRGLIPK